MRPAWGGWSEAARQCGAAGVEAGAGEADDDFTRGMELVQHDLSARWYRARAASVRALGKEHEAREDEEKAEELAAQEARERNGGSTMSRARYRVSATGAAIGGPGKLRGGGGLGAATRTAPRAQSLDSEAESGGSEAGLGGRRKSAGKRENREGKA